MRWLAVFGWRPEDHDVLLRIERIFALRGLRWRVKKERRWRSNKIYPC